MTMKYNHVMRTSCLAALICLSLSAVSWANGPAADSAKASDPAFSVSTVANPIPDEAIKDLEIVEDQGRWLVSDKALEQYGIREADHAKGTYWFRLPKAQNGSTAWQNENVQLTLPGRAVSGGRTINIRHVRRPLGISYVLGNGTTEKNELLPPSQPVHTVPELRQVQDAVPAAAKEGKMGTVLFWDPVMKEDASLPSLQTRQPVMSPCAFRLTESGVELRNPDFDMLASTYTSKGYVMWPLIDNNFNPKLTHQVLSNSRLQDTMVRQLVGYALLYDFKGYNIDFENVNYSDKDALTVFVAKLSQACHAYGIQLSMDVTPVPTGPWSMTGRPWLRISTTSWSWPMTSSAGPARQPALSLPIPGSNGLYRIRSISYRRRKSCWACRCTCACGMNPAMAAICRKTSTTGRLSSAHRRQRA